MSSVMRGLTASAVALSLVAVPTGAIAARPAQPVAPSQNAASAPVASNQWVTLSAMTSNSTAAANAAAAQDYDGDGPGWPPLPVLAVILATVALAIWILVHDDDDGDDDVEVPVSPA